MKNTEFSLIGRIDKRNRDLFKKFIRECPPDTKEIKITINSLGGNFHEAMLMCRLIYFLRTKKGITVTMVADRSYSAAFLIFIMGNSNKREAYKNNSVGIHLPTPNNHKDFLLTPRMRELAINLITGYTSLSVNEIIENDGIKLENEFLASRKIVHKFV